MATTATPRTAAATFILGTQSTVPARHRTARSSRLPAAAWLFGAVLVFNVIAVGSRAEADDDVQFNRDIRPFLSNACFKCHGPDRQTREADLRLDQEDDAKADRDGYAAIVPGDVANSAIVKRVLSSDPDEKMPPPDSGLKLTDDQIGLLKRWIASGATYQKHWAFEPLVKPRVPAQARPGVPGDAQPSPIDYFINDRIEQAGLKPQPAADPLTQLRRVTLDLTGLSPTIPAADAFLQEVEERGADAAYAAAVDRLFQSPRYGERMAWQWLEAARYADTDGYQNDGPRTMWRWRDWVIDAYNRNMPFDQFTIEQLAGDLLPNATLDQKIATAFNRNHRYNSEAGIPIDEFLLENAVDRVDTTATVWMGLSLGCSRCHDHKYDPFTQREYYQLVDYFNDVAESGRAVKYGNSEPWIKSPTAAQQQRLSELDRAVDSARKALDDSRESISAARRTWEATAQAIPPVVQNGLDQHFTFDSDDDRVKIQNGQPVFRAGLLGNAATVGGKGNVLLGKIPGLIGNGRFSIAFWIRPEQVDAGPVLSNEIAGTTRSGILVSFAGGHLRWDIIHRWISGVSTIETRRKFEPDRWAHVVLTNDGTQRADGMQIFVDGQLQEVLTIRNTNSNAAGRNQGAAMSIGYSKHVGYWKGQVDDLRFYTHRTLAADEARWLAVPKPGAQILATPAADRSDAEVAWLQRAFLEHGAAEDHRKLLAAVQTAAAERTRFWDSLPTTMIMSDLPGGRPSFVRKRGVYDQFGEPVSGGVPAVFPGLSAGKNDRLALARWLVSDRHPLTPRVTVNRYWQLLFGRGLVDTPEDFGSQGELPSHPRLLDWLAATFVESGWDVKGLLKTIVTSDAYRRSSDVTSEHLKADPKNVLLARAPRIRLAGNVLRDQALFVSGLLVEQQGGPSVYPYQPANLWREASNFRYKQGTGDDLYRRSLYSYWKRTLAPPTMSLLNAADREWCSVKPQRTSTPLQALTLLNDVTFTEAARKLGERMLAEGGKSAAERIGYGFRLVATRRPTHAELDVLTRAWQSYHDNFAGNPKLAAATIKIGKSGSTKNFATDQLAAATALANVLLNLDEVTTRN